MVSTVGSYDKETFENKIDAGDCERFEILMSQHFDFHSLAFLPTWLQEELSKIGSFSQEIKDFLIKNSLICHEVGTGNPASDRICRVVYGDSYLGWGPIDDWISRGLGGRSLFNRLPQVSNLLVDHLRKVSAGNYRIKDLGAGSGAYAFKTLGILQTLGFPISGITWECIDCSDDAIRFGEERARENGFFESIKFRKDNFLTPTSYPTNDHDYADLQILVGVLCGMTKEDAVKCLKKIKPHGKDHSKIIAATLLVKSYKEDPLVYQVLAKLGWYLRPKTMAEVEDVFTKAGYKITAINSERLDQNGKEIPGEYAIVTAEL